VPGGFAPDFLRVDEPTLRFVAAMHRAEKWVTAICHGPQLLISTDATQGTDIVRGRKVAGVEMIRDDLATPAARSRTRPRSSTATSSPAAAPTTCPSTAWRSSTR
jgi:protease I